MYPAFVYNLFSKSWLKFSLKNLIRAYCSILNREVCFYRMNNKLKNQGIMNEELKKASERWKKEGKEYKTAINEWLDIIYIKNEDPTTPCPEETRKDMAVEVLENLIEYNTLGKHKEFRELFPPDNDPLSDLLNNSSIWYKIRKTALLADNTILAKIGDYYEWQGVYIIKDDKIEDIEDLIGFGFSYDKKYFAKVYNDRIDIHEGWEGTITSTLNLPDNNLLEELQYDSIEVFSTGKQVILTTHNGIFIINEKGYELIHGGETEDEDAEFLHYPHAALSPDDKYIALGSQMSSHLILKEQNGKWEQVTSIEPFSSYPNITCFNYQSKDPFIALGSCHFSQSGTVGINLKNIENMQSPDENFDEDSIFIIDNRRWIFSMYPLQNGLLLGANDGYIWFHTNDNKTKYIYIGGTIMSMDMSADKKHMLVSTSCGQIVLLSCEKFDFDNSKNPCTDPYLISNLPVIDEKRYLFVSGCQPLVW